MPFSLSPGWKTVAFTRSIFFRAVPLPLVFSTHLLCLVRSFTTGLFYPYLVTFSRL
ncbi:hypothetical protein K402DRAFT_391103 [Aulographum hederae CBS 113979]|uniref:Uncharacterized protein n=1 Tax=Aulographum hederae CBS 113979 TaxID=1176131 RepID=A0A6G1H8G6_9PEZI|nr:hypothetical protein K402DRAFT_391103 [Aulographum hederae CBS 113979]